MRSSRRSRGFTLAEILVVLAIIAVLTAILLPVLSRVRENGRKVACASNLQQLGLAFQQYNADWNGRYPLAGLYTDFASTKGWDTTSTASWVGGTYNEPIAQIGAGPGFSKPIENASSPTGYNIALPEKGSLFPYSKEKSIYVCPSNIDGRKKQLSYTMNCALSNLSSFKIRQPAEIVLLVDEQEANDGYFFATNNNTATPQSPGATAVASGAFGDSKDALEDIHNGGGNLLFVDGHVKFYTFKTFVLDGSEAGKTNKYRQEGTPRFHDRAFGPRDTITGEFKGSYYRTGNATDSCAAPITP